MYKMKDYLCSEKDIKSVEKALNKLIDSSPSKKVFSLGDLDKIDIVLIDSKYLNIFSKKELDLDFVKESVKGYKLYKKEHKSELEEGRLGYCGGEINKLLESLGIKLNNYFTLAPLETFIQHQKKKGNSCWENEEGYSFTIFHEFAHEYFSIHSNIDEKLEYFKTTFPDLNDSNRGIPPHPLLVHEIFAAICELKLAMLFESDYFNDLTQMLDQEMKEMKEYFFDIHNMAYFVARNYVNNFDNYHDKLIALDFVKNKFK
ncbi:hypothetical protein HOE22_12555 [Candidatus Woesearchaeota archaeon]|jgi:hypothetical protein|nr:hypothetical protein [Candidatus Woesearchaeota archaeon]MBT4732413.1 hypothetical protein [Candidatus Woesearchaeota archaeon]MBT5042824.1 hypothetical protein [Candidatus Woesearchaeota archaeon]MBT5558110.1 hypothetical protein [Candidatus Woesearchaeota archaeon]MBT6761127.1 hypothetical protein [Candidatus Woesearchaeota archaeon]